MWIHPFIHLTRHPLLILMWLGPTHYQDSSITVDYEVTGSDSNRPSRDPTIHLSSIRLVCFQNQGFDGRQLTTPRLETFSSNLSNDLRITRGSGQRFDEEDVRKWCYGEGHQTDSRSLLNMLLLCYVTFESHISNMTLRGCTLY